MFFLEAKKGVMELDKDSCWPIWAHNSYPWLWTHEIMQLKFQDSWIVFLTSFVACKHHLSMFYQTIKSNWSFVVLEVMVERNIILYFLILGSCWYLGVDITTIVFALNFGFNWNQQFWQFHQTNIHGKWNKLLFMPTAYAQALIPPTSSHVTIYWVPHEPVVQ